ncbi:uncharacterized protein TRIADDRAFT_54198 [Trichoplax adhaerens]|uniref:Uncharacterized protein n=1 Tax=Trichoplax adhaerens TaxID=10228 RepID=B3RRD6_TRIAD|nr:hypothetical protein TRIADDRAFT_54198 [Trichoplax adhaerens]EDV26325.1 hypothetical protein TRIADDRAFT_54198 [Trichoplax adhaerens]|eukprot:XP_002110321.1 hypothetical protein TRIADDRAFT_54198 [Trichoplax adhaerens]
MGRLPVGKATGHVLASQSADIDLNRFYVTAYSTNYNKKEFEPKPGRHIGTGYASNLRSAIGYSKKLDDVDNPAMGQILVDAYASGTLLRDYKGSVLADGKEALPSIHMQTLSGFAKDIPKTLTVSKEVKQSFFDTDGSSSLLPKHRALLSTLKKHDPIRDENEGYGPGYMKSETLAKFQGQSLRRANTADSTIGRKELSGFSKAFTTEPITFRAYTAKGKETFPSIASRGRRSDGYTEGTTTKNVYLENSNFHGFTDQEDLHPKVRDYLKKKDPLEYVNITNPTRNINLNKIQFDGRLVRDKSNSEKIGLVKYGNKELSGFTTNNISKINNFDRANAAEGFLTTYNAKFRNVNSGKNFSQRSPANINPAKPDGYTKSIQVHKSSDTTAALRKLNPYVARSIKRRDPYYDDHVYDHKIRRK